MRQFYLVNSDGQRYQLQNDRTTAFLWKPAGLGFNYDRDYAESGGFFFEMNKAIGQTAKTGTLLFHGADPYAQYKTFMDYISRSKGLRLAYAPKSTWYYVDIDIESVEKSEIEEDGTLQCSIVMMPKTPLYLPYELNIDLSGDLGESIKQYDYEYNLDTDGLGITTATKCIGESSSAITDGGTEWPSISPIQWWPQTLQTGDYVLYNGEYFIWQSNKWHKVAITEDSFWYKYSNTAVAGEIEFEIPAQMDSGLEIIIPGEISAPVLSFYVNDELIGRIDLSSITVLEGEYVRYSSIPQSAGVYIYSGGTETDITEQIGLDAEVPTFFLLPPNTTIKVVMSADAITGTSATLKVYEYFMSV